MKEIETEYPIQLADRTGLVCVNRAELKDILLSAGALDPLVDDIRKMAKNLIADPLTAEGRKQIREMGERVKSYARDLDKYRKAVVDVLKEEPKTIDANVREARKAIEAIEAEVMAPVLDVDARAEKLRLMAERPNILTAAPEKELRVELAQAEAMDVSPSIWHEAADAAIAVKAGLIDVLNTMLEKRVEVERQQAEFEAFQRKVAEEKQEREKEEARQQGIREGEARAKAEQYKRDLIVKEAFDAIDRATEISKAERYAIEEAKAKQRTVEAVTREIVAETAPVAPIADDDFDSDKSRIERFLMRMPPVPELRDADKRARIIDIINRAVSAIKGV